MKKKIRKLIDEEDMSSSGKERIVHIKGRVLKDMYSDTLEYYDKERNDLKCRSLAESISTIQKILTPEFKKKFDELLLARYKADKEVLYTFQFGNIDPKEINLLCFYLEKDYQTMQGCYNGSVKRFRDSRIKEKEIPTSRTSETISLIFFISMGLFFLSPLLEWARIHFALFYFSEVAYPVVAFCFLLFIIASITFALTKKQLDLYQRNNFLIRMQMLEKYAEIRNESTNHV